MRRGSFIASTGVLVSVGATLVANLVAAQPLGASVAFDEGRRLLADGRVAEACERFASSHQQEPALGTLLNLADCRERLGETATAFKLFNEAQAWAERNHEARRVQAAKARADALKPRLSMVAVEVLGNAPRASVEVFASTVQGPAVARWNLEVPQAVALDPGRYEVAVACDGYEPTRVPFAVTVPGVMKVVVPALRPRAASEPAVAVAPRPATVAPPGPLAVVDARPPRWAGPTSVGVGAAFVVGFGLLFGVALDVLVRTGAQQQDQAALTVTRQAYQTAVWQAVVGSVGAAAGLAAVSVGVALLGRDSGAGAQVALGGAW
ncbi:MAG: hypothetical protein MUC96_33110 [Myxococcaceae bacterium]|nr:hypothetical protein [Myxococcaceae bacterium]